MIGTLPYAAPEQVRGADELDRRADVYGLGATLYAALTGRPPFQTASAEETLHQVLTADPAPPRVLNPAVPRDLEVVCLKCLRKDPRDRYPTAADLAADLRRFLDNKPVLARPLPV
jgi:serine/threonine-protein kinase